MRISDWSSDVCSSDLSLSASACVFAAHTTGCYARVRTQFGIPVGQFEGVQEKLGRLAANAYLVEAARRFTCAGLDLGHKPAVISAIMKLHATERMRQSVTDAMDIPGGKNGRASCRERVCKYV